MSEVKSEETATNKVQRLTNRLTTHADSVLLNEDHVADRELCLQAAASITELKRRLDEAHAVMIRVEKAAAKKHYDPGETLDDVMEDLTELLSDERLEREIFGE